MKKTIILSLALCGAYVAGFTSCTSSAPSPTLSSSLDSASYAIGINIGSGLKENLKQTPGEPLNVDNLIAGLTTAIKDSAGMKITPDQAMQIVQNYFEKITKEEATLTLEAGQKFIAEKEKEEGVVKTASGLLYKVEKEGNGPKPTASNQIKVNYKGTTTDGTVFDSTEGREPAILPLGSMIPGWVEGIQLMSVGSKYIFYIPAELAYGEQARGQVIKPNSALAFEVELLDIVKDQDKK